MKRLMLGVWLRKLGNPQNKDYGKGFLPPPATTTSSFNKPNSPAPAPASNPYMKEDVSKLKVNQVSFKKSNSNNFTRKDSNRKRKRKTIPKEKKEGNPVEPQTGEDYFECSLCSYKSIIEPGKYHLTRNSARSNMIAHFNTHHNPVQIKDVFKLKTEKKEFYACTLCDFTVNVTSTESQMSKLYRSQRRSAARLGLSRHYVATHHKFKEGWYYFSKEKSSKLSKKEPNSVKEGAKLESEDQPAKKVKERGKAHKKSNRIFK